MLQYTGSKHKDLCCGDLDLGLQGLGALGFHAAGCRLFSILVVLFGGVSNYVYIYIYIYLYIYIMY